MKPLRSPAPFVAIACGGTGGHLFPGLAVADELRRRGCAVALLISPKDVDQQAVKTALERRLPARREPLEPLPRAVREAGAPLSAFTLPAVGLQNRNYFSFTVSFLKSFFAARKFFKSRRPDAVLAMGGFTSAPPVLAGKLTGAKTFLHESNTIPGKANRLLARWVDVAFVGFPEAAARLPARSVETSGTPVRPQFCGEAGDPRRPADCRAALGLSPDCPTVLVVGGSQGAHGLNELILSALPLLKSRDWQWLHLAGAADFETVKAAYAANGIKAVVKPFLAEMDLALGAATACVSRAGASSLAELAAMRLPALLVPLPTAADNHQCCNAAAFEKTGAARRLDQGNSPPERVAASLAELVENETARRPMQAALARWHAPQSAARIAEHILRSMAQAASESSKLQAPSSGEATNPKGQGVARAGLFGAWFLVLLWSWEFGAWSLFPQ